MGRCFERVLQLHLMLRLLLTGGGDLGFFQLRLEHIRKNDARSPIFESVVLSKVC